MIPDDMEEKVEASRGLRDKFALAALTGLLANPQVAFMFSRSSRSDTEFMSDAARTAFAYADAMIAERSKG